MIDEEITAWVTKHALTSGVMKVSGRVSHRISNGRMFSYGRSTAHGDDWHRTPELAREKAEAMRAKKIAALRRQIEKLEKMIFEVTP